MLCSQLPLPSTVVQQTKAAQRLEVIDPNLERYCLLYTKTNRFECFVNVTAVRKPSMHIRNRKRLVVLVSKSFFNICIYNLLSLFKDQRALEAGLRCLQQLD